MKLSPLQLKSLYFTKVSISSDPEGAAEDIDKVNVETVTECFSPGQADDWYVILKVKFSALEGVKAPHWGELEILGSFSVEASWPKEKANQLVYINGSGILYTAAREMISNITARGFHKVLTLPVLSFFEMFKEDEAKKKQPSLPLESDPKTPTEPSPL